MYTFFPGLATELLFSQGFGVRRNQSGPAIRAPESGLKRQFLIDIVSFLDYNELKKFREMIQLEITVNTTMGEMLEYDMGIAYVLMQCGMHCVGCPSSIGESLEEACAVHGLNPDDVLAEINAYLEARETV